MTTVNNDHIEPLHFWNGSNIITLTTEDVTGCRDMPCVDEWGTNDQYRYGAFTARGWKHMPFDEFPSEFKMALMLIGVR